MDNNNNQNNNPQRETLNNLNIKPTDSNNKNIVQNNSVNTNLNNPIPNNQPSSPLDSMNVETSNKKKKAVSVVTPQPTNTAPAPKNNSLNDLNVDGKYNKLEKSIYADDPIVKKNIEEHNGKKPTVKISQEMKIFIIIAVVMLIFIFIMPTIFDLIQNLRFD